MSYTDRIDSAAADLARLEEQLSLYTAIRDSLIECDLPDSAQQLQKHNEHIEKLEREVSSAQGVLQRQRKGTISAAPPRKRGFASSSLASASDEHRFKSRRTTPGYPVMADVQEAIDLTGDDDDLSFIGAPIELVRRTQRSYEQDNRSRREQEERDHQLAIRLSRMGDADDEVEFLDDFDPPPAPMRGPAHVRPTQTAPPQRIYAAQTAPPRPSSRIGTLGTSSAASGRAPLFYGGYNPDLPLIVPSSDSDSPSVISVRSSYYNTSSTTRPGSTRPTSDTSDTDSALHRITSGLPGSFPADPSGQAVQSRQSNSFVSARSLLDDPYYLAGKKHHPMFNPELNTESTYGCESGFDFHGQSDPTVTAEDLNNLLSNLSDVEIPLQDQQPTPEGLRYPLYPHQQQALTWMIKHEEGTNKGGILADDMGLGKTISATALMLKRPSPGPVKTTLIIGPVALIRQWEEELRDKLHRSHRLTTFLLHGQNKAPIDELLKYDVVLTTYGTIAWQKKTLDNYLEENQNRNIDVRSDRTLLSKCSLLHPTKSKFWRVILDEAQNIKNDKTKAAVACAAIRAEHRWCLTGTPMMNNIMELYSLIKFLRIKPYNSRSAFDSAFKPIGGNDEVAKQRAMSKLQALVQAIMLRRLKSSVINGKPILQLPRKEEQIVYAKFSEEEQKFYDELQHHSQVQLNKYLRAGTVGKNYSCILVLLLRLRQACCHPHLNLDAEEAPSADSAPEDVLVALARSLDEAVVRRLLDMDEDGLECPICYDAPQGPLILTPCGHNTCKECLSSIADLAANNRAHNISNTDGPGTISCPYCKGAVDPNKAIPYSIFRKIHMPEAEAAEAARHEHTGNSSSKSDFGFVSNDESDDEDDDDDEDEEEDDDTDKYGNIRGFVVSDSDTDDDDDDDQEDRKGKKPAVKAKHSDKKRRGRGKRSGKAKPKRLKDGDGSTSAIKASDLRRIRAEATRNMEAKTRYFNFLNQHWLSSAKVDECIKLLREIQPTGEKTIIFSQWTSLLDLIQVAMHREKLGRPCRYDGSMSANARNESAHRFRDPRSREKVILVSLKAGNAGLNLTAASRVIIMDPFWNPYVELQAIDRAYRIGQTKEVQVYRILAQDTVEDRIIKLQDSKKQMVDTALDEAGGKAIGRLSVGELRFMFGL